MKYNININYMKLEKIIIVLLIIFIMFMLTQTPNQQSNSSQITPGSDRVIVVERTPPDYYIGGQGPIWRGPRPGRRRRWRRRRRWWF